MKLRLLPQVATFSLLLLSVTACLKVSQESASPAAMEPSETFSSSR